MTPERVHQIEHLYHSALERAPEQRPAFLEEAAAGDEDLRLEVESLLRPAVGPLDEPLWQVHDGSRLKPGAQLGPYQILGAVGAGGMGAVYKARDTRLGRTVAIKVSSARFSDRFEQEARAIAALNHPYICTLHDIGPNYLVMELVEGRQLKGPLPLDEALRYAVQIADALDAAHRKGIVHRDLKPGNILVTRSGVKLLDFGLAKIAPNSTDGPQSCLTSEGAILGTLQYMSPEQVQGKSADARSDIFSFGAVLYEMVTGKRAFDGDNTAAIISALMAAGPPALGTLASSVPQALERVVRRCLAKDPDGRWQTARDLHAELRWILDAPAETVPSAVAAGGKNWKRWLAAAAAVVTLAAATWMAADRFAKSPEPPQAVRSSLLPPPGFSFVPSQFAISPDGRHLAFAAVGVDGRNTLWVRNLSGSTAQQLRGTEDASRPFWSPDSHQIGFFTREKLKTIDIAGGAVQIVSEALDGLGGSWSRDGTIVFSPDIAGPLDRVTAAGGALARATRIARDGSGQSHRWPAILPDGTHFLYLVDLSGPGDAQSDGLYAGSLATPDAKPVLAHLRSNVSFASGNLLFVSDRNLLAQPFDPGTLEITGPPVPIAQQELEMDQLLAQSGFSASDNGLLVFQSAADAPTRMNWFDARGRELSQLPVAGYKDPSLSPDGRLLAVSSDDAHNGKYFIRIIDLERGIGTRLTSGGNERSPRWTRDGKFITYQATTNETTSIVQVPSDGSGTPRTLLKGANVMTPIDWSPDGHLAYMDFSKGPPHVEIYSADPRAVTDLGEGAEPQFSPDGKWIAYADNEIFVQPVEGLARRIQISSMVSAQPRWSHDGRRLFYIQPDRKLMEVEFDANKRAASAPRLLFQTRIVAPNFVFLQYDVAPDGRFLINSFPPDASAPLTLITGWTALLKAY